MNLNKITLIFISLHIIVIALSNYLVQIPLYFFSIATNLGTFSFPIIFLLSDLAVRTFGIAVARKIVIYALFPALILSYLISVLFIDGTFTSIVEIFNFNSFVARIIAASFLAYAIGQFLDISVFNKLRTNQFWILAPLVSTTIGSLVDTFSFYAIAFYQSENEFMSQNWFEMAVFDYGFKMLVSILIFIPLYKLIANYLANLIAANTFKKATN